MSLIRSIRFGDSEALAALPTINVAIGLARKYAENGTAVAKQIEYGFYREADRIPAEIIAEYVARISASDALFNAAREIERASMNSMLPSFDEMSSEAKSLLGVFLDFNGISREKIAVAWPRIVKTSGDKGPSSGGNAEASSLFTASEPKDESIPPAVKQ